MSQLSCEYSSIKNELETQGFYVCRSYGVSMQPLFKTHRDVIVLESPKRELKKYDVVLYGVGDDEYFLHRIIKVTPDHYLIRGDNTFVIERVKKESVIGVLISYTRNGKKHSVSDFSYKLYSRVWNFIYPFRFILRKSRIFLGRVYRKLFKGGKK